MKVVLWFLMMFMPLLANASSVNEEQLFHRLDSYIAQRSKFTGKFSIEVQKFEGFQAL